MKKTKFKPDAELLKFATYFSDNYKSLPAGEYHSDGGKYSVKYLNRIRDKHSGNICTTLSRIGVKYGIIEIDRSEFRRNEKLTHNYVFYSIIWCVIRNFMHNCMEMKEYFDVDRIANEYYISTNRPKKDVAIGWIIQLKRAGDNFDLRERVEKTMNQLMKARSKQKIKSDGKIKSGVTKG